MSGSDQAYRLEENCADPSAETTTILFHLPQSRRVRLQLFKEDGALVDTLVDEQCAAGDHTITMDTARLPNGRYFYRITAGAFESVRQMVIARCSAPEVSDASAERVD